VELSLTLRRVAIIIAATVTTLAFALPTYAQSHQGGEASLELPDLAQVTFFNGVSGHNLLLFGIIICVLGLGFGLAIYMNLAENAGAPRHARDLRVDLRDV
jgi:K(+)-stimulated pyrophosphate-energized sodium pump